MIVVQSVVKYASGHERLVCPLNTAIGDGVNSINSIIAEYHRNWVNQLDSRLFFISWNILVS